ncbi:hypothetical protein EPN90_00735 [Patescibacteria group bacterium]|nr:MAG: hypothetical protein EPN90_00735 [Patescibacteria group bacterium]
MRFFGSKIFLVTLLAAVIFVGMGVGRMIVQNRALAREVAALAAEAETLESKNDELVELAKRVQTDSFIERDARLKLGLKKPGEDVLVVRRQGEASSTVQVAREEENNSARWWRYFFAPKSSSKL